jgi:hypothetical protein
MMNCGEKLKSRELLGGDIDAFVIGVSRTPNPAFHPDAFISILQIARLPLAPCLS